ncbi:MAG: N(4)-(beta-N-acetylglucosaminyl)-L-asparaginase, partial [Phycisphaerales bacterium]|nr:N(4)-(beta-N-acetylglucosaminyl)-L-asparaginase [Phycisphaerales bacterium]
RGAGETSPVTPPIILSTWSFGQRGHAMAWPILASGGSSLDAVEQACRVVESDPEVDSVGFGGLPDASGEVSLDASIMLSPSRHGSVTYVRRFLHVASLARCVMERTPHRMLSGDGAERFALEQGFEPTSLLSNAARSAWETWRTSGRGAVDQSRDSGRGLRPVDADQSGRLFVASSEMAGHDTIGTLAIDRSGVIAGACSTSGMPYKLPGRVGDSPIIGHGLYVDPEVGASTATGTGELIMGVCGSFLIVELLRRGASPAQAIREALGRIERTQALRPEHQVAFVTLTPRGEWSAGALRPGFKVAIRDDATDAIVDPPIVLRRD